MDLLIKSQFSTHHLAHYFNTVLIVSLEICISINKPSAGGLNTMGGGRVNRGFEKANQVPEKGALAPSKGVIISKSQKIYTRFPRYRFNWYHIASGVPPPSLFLKGTGFASIKTRWGTERIRLKITTKQDQTLPITLPT